MQRMKDLGRVVVAAAATVLALAPQAAAEDLLKVAVAQRGPQGVNLAIDLGLVLALVAREGIDDIGVQGLAEDLGEQLAAVKRAEERLAAGTYGLSIESGEPIPDERLEALPTAELTAEEERRRRP